MSAAMLLPPSLLLRDDVLIRFQRRVGLAPADGLGTLRRAVFLGLLGWLPVVVWAWFAGRASDGDNESLLAHYAITARLLVAVPLMVIAESVLLGAVRALSPQFVSTCLLPDDRTAIRAAVTRLVRLRDRSHPWVVGVAVVLAWLLAAGGGLDSAPRAHQLAWAGEDDAQGFGVLWYLWVGRPIFIACVAVWLWRTFLLGVALHRLPGLGLRFVPTHPDRLGGLGFFGGLMIAFGMVAFALSGVIAAGWAHEVTQHGLDVNTLRMPMVATVLLLTAIFLAPMFVLVGPISRAKKLARLQYGALIARHGNALHRKWIDGESVDDALLEAPEIGAAADAATLYEAVGRMLPVPVTVASVAMVALPAALPMLVVASLQIPVATLIKQLVSALL
jgi:hypothetical protein